MKAILGESQVRGDFNIEVQYGTGYRTVFKDALVRKGFDEDIEDLSQVISGSNEGGC